LDALSSCALAALRARAEAEREGPAQATPSLYGWRERHSRRVSEVAEAAASEDLKEEEKASEKADVFDNESNPPPDMPKSMSEPII
jgi:hypothetical protein